MRIKPKIRPVDVKDEVIDFVCLAIDGSKKQPNMFSLDGGETWEMGIHSSRELARALNKLCAGLGVWESSNIIESFVELLLDHDVQVELMADKRTGGTHGIDPHGQAHS